MWKGQYLLLLYSTQYPCSYSNRLLSESSKTVAPKVGPWTCNVSITWDLVEMLRWEGRNMYPLQEEAGW